jgi:hypothetical protein
MLCNITTDAGNWRAFEPQLRAFLGKLPISGAVALSGKTVEASKTR